MRRTHLYCTSCKDYQPKTESCIYSYATIDPKTGLCLSHEHLAGSNLDQWLKEAPTT